MAKKICISDIRKNWCKGCDDRDNFGFMVSLTLRENSDPCPYCKFYENGKCPERLILTGERLSKFSFVGLINGKRENELSAIFNALKNELGSSEEEICETIIKLTSENGAHKKGNKLWMALKEKYPGKTFEVGIYDLSIAILEEMEK